MLEPYTVLDFTDERGELGPMILGDLGADVIRVEPPDGSAARTGQPGTAQGESFRYRVYNRNKRSIVLDPDSAEDQDTLRALIAAAHFIFEPAPNGGLAGYGLDYQRARELNPRIVFVQLSAFGTQQAYADYLGNDLVIAAMGGPVALQGVPERAPVRLSVPQVWRHAGAEAAAAAMLAFQRMLNTGEAQFVDLSAQSVMTWTTLNAMTAHAIQGFDFQRSGGVVQTGAMATQLVYAARDGYVVAIPHSRVIVGCLDWMIEDGVADPALKALDWEEYDFNLRDPNYAGFGVRDGEKLCAAFFARHDKESLFRFGLEKGISIAPINTLTELVNLDHLEARAFWQDGEVKTPGLWVKSPSVDLGVRNPAPELGEQSDEIRDWLASHARSELPDPNNQPLPFAGLRVADFSWVGVGPISAKFLADNGADVIRVESETRPDVLRAAGPFKDNEAGWNRSQFYGDFNTSKRSLSLDLKKPQAMALARDLIARSDILIESFAPGAMQRMGLTYEALSREHPGLIMISTCLMGQTGPAAGLAGYGYHAGAIAGFYEVTGWPDLGPNGPWVAYTDTIAPRFISALLVAAIDHRRRTGQGAYFDLAQIETALQFLAPELVDLQTNGFQASRQGNRARFAAPQGCYPCQGDDRWCAIAIDTDVQWQALCRVLERDDLTALNVNARLARHDELDDALSAWTRDRPAGEVARTLQSAGVPAGVVQRSSDLLEDPQYAARRFYRWMDHPEMGCVPYAGPQYLVSGFDNGPRFRAPCLGEHSFEILSELLGLSDEAIAEAYANGIVA